VFASVCLRLLALALFQGSFPPTSSLELSDFEACGQLTFSSTRDEMQGLFRH